MLCAAAVQCLTSNALCVMSTGRLPPPPARCSLHWQPALTALLARVAEAQQDTPRLLSELFAAPPEAEPLDVQRVAAQQAAVLLQQRAAAAARSKKVAGQQGECTQSRLG